MEWSEMKWNVVGCGDHDSGSNSVQGAASYEGQLH